MIKEKTKRLFIAFNPPKVAQDKIAGIIKGLDKECSGVQWVKADKLHLTLHFLGNINEDKEEKLKLIMQTMVGKFHELNFSLGRISAFPNMSNPRVIILDLKQINGNSAPALQKLLGRQISSIVRIDKRLWRPHITIGRIKALEKFSWPKKIPVTPKIDFKINSFELMQSKLHPDSSEYKIIEKYSFYQSSRNEKN